MFKLSDTYSEETEEKEEDSDFPLVSSSSFSCLFFWVSISYVYLFP